MSLRTFCPARCLVPRMFCTFVGCFVFKDVLSLGCFVPRMFFPSGHFVPRMFCPWTFSLRTLCLKTFGLCTKIPDKNTHKQQSIQPRRTIAVSRRDGCLPRYLRSWSHEPEADDDELGILGSLFYVVGHDRDVFEVQGSVNLVHHVQGCRLMQVKIIWIFGCRAPPPQKNVFIYKIQR